MSLADCIRADLLAAVLDGQVTTATLRGMAAVEAILNDGGAPTVASVAHRAAIRKASAVAAIDAYARFSTSCVPREAIGQITVPERFPNGSHMVPTRFPHGSHSVPIGNRQTVANHDNYAQNCEEKTDIVRPAGSAMSTARACAHVQGTEHRMCARAHEGGGGDGASAGAPYAQARDVPVPRTDGRTDGPPPRLRGPGGEALPLVDDPAEWWDDRELWIPRVECHQIAVALGGRPGAIGRLLQGDGQRYYSVWMTILRWRASQSDKPADPGSLARQCRSLTERAKRGDQEARTLPYDYVDHLLSLRRKAIHGDAPKPVLRTVGMTPPEERPAQIIAPAADGIWQQVLAQVRERDRMAHAILADAPQVDAADDGVTVHVEYRSQVAVCQKAVAGLTPPITVVGPPRAPGATDFSSLSDLM